MNYRDIIKTAYSHVHNNGIVVYTCMHWTATVGKYQYNFLEHLIEHFVQ